jgi:hypothetical protein
MISTCYDVQQVQFNKKTEKAWSDLIPHLKEISAETGMSISSTFPIGGAADGGGGGAAYNYAAAPPAAPAAYSTHSGGGGGSNFREEEEEEDLVGV